VENQPEQFEHRNIALVAGALAWNPSATVETPAKPDGAYIVRGVPSDFAVRVARREIIVNLADQLAATNNLLMLRRVRGGRA
jgi:hypothetical protein